MSNVPKQKEAGSSDAITGHALMFSRYLLPSPPVSTERLKPFCLPTLPVHAYPSSTLPDNSIHPPLFSQFPFLLLLSPQFNSSVNWPGQILRYLQVNSPCWGVLFLSYSNLNLTGVEEVSMSGDLRAAEIFRNKGRQMLRALLAPLLSRYL